ncbi:nitrogen assimilation transcriptional activator NtcB [Geminocystis sp. NIES-3708]|uniref:LysR family transcriptional regulator n=1 Tax=Geminocystis sp. NIES-3708 TaxID=1615909 RepID=UPI0005FCBE3F|nr:LysR family transcriptional regulator [Geminocystis sp. NIES-3708]BAQ62400.1 nitrogen assimilation transcriptional activator NtcB [Geminocystis sp. NIES-3708]
MRIEQIKAFLAVSETGSFGQAAKLCGVTQSTISRQVQGLEVHLKTALFHRQAQAKLTVSGEKLLPHARRICQEWEKVEEKIQELLGGEQPELCVAAIHSVCAYYLPPLLQDFCKNHPQVQLRVTALGSDRALKVLRDGLVDVALVMNNKYLTSSSDMIVKHLYYEAIQVLVSNNHPLATQKNVTIAELAKYSQVIFKDGYGMQRIVQDIFASNGFELEVAMELNTLDAFRGVIRQGNLIALLPELALQESKLDPTLAIIPINMPSNYSINSQLTREVVLITTKDRLEIPTVRDFFNLVYEYGKTKDK